MSGKKQNVYDAGFVDENTIQRSVKNPRIARPRTKGRTSKAQSAQNSQATKPQRPVRTLSTASKAVSRSVKYSALNARTQSKSKETSKNKAKKKTSSPKGENIKKKISNQSPSARKKQKLDKKITGSATKIEVKSRVHREKATFRIKKKNNSFKTAIARIILFFATLALISGVVFCLFALNLKSDTENNSSLHINVGDKNDPQYYSYYTSNCQLDSVYYICADDLLNLYSMTVMGTNEHLHYIVSESDEYVSFDVGTRNATVNGSPIKLERACFMMYGRLYVPASFFTSYSEGFNFEVKDGEMNIERVETLKATNGKLNYGPISFKLKPVSIATVMSEDDAKGDGVLIKNGKDKDED